MLSTRTRSILFVTALSVAAFGLQTEPADAARKASTANRDAMIEQCIAKAHAEAPIVVADASGNRRTEIYKNCMVQAGMRP